MQIKEDVIIGTCYYRNQVKLHYVIQKDVKIGRCLSKEGVRLGGCYYRNHTIIGNIYVH